MPGHSDTYRYRDRTHEPVGQREIAGDIWSIKSERVRLGPGAWLASAKATRSRSPTTANRFARIVPFGAPTSHNAADTGPYRRDVSNLVSEQRRFSDPGIRYSELDSVTRNDSLLVPSWRRREYA